MNFKKALFAAVAMSAVTACSSTWDVDAVKNMETKGSAFDKALKHEYTELAAAERDEHDWADTAMFLERAKAAADGASPAPEAVTARKIKEKYAEEVRVARERLVRTLDAGTRVTAPADSASAQAGYECWTQELEEDIQPDDIKSCRDKFDAAMNVIERAPASKAGKATAITSPSIVVGKNRYVIYFSFNSSQVMGDGRAVLKKIADEVIKNNITEINVAGFTDTSGKDVYNLGLSKSRANTVFNALKKSGLEKQTINTKAYGETNLAVQTADGVREPRNRRVEITIGK